MKPREDAKIMPLKVRALMNTALPLIPMSNDTSLMPHTKLPLSRLSALGVAFEPIAAAVQNVFGGAAGAQSGLYRVTIPSGGELAKFKDGSGYLGSVLSETGSVGGGQARLAPLRCDPTVLFMAMVLANVEQKLDAIQEMQQELMDYLAQKERSELRGSITFLGDVLTNYKYNWNNDKFKNSNHIKVLDIMQTAEQKIDFYKEQISAKLKKKSLLESDGEVKRQLAKIRVEFKDYQLSLYLYAFSSFMQVMLLENFDKAYLASIVQKIENCAFEYRVFYSRAYDQLEGKMDQSIQTTLLKGLAQATRTSGKMIEKIPLISKMQIDETLIGAGEKMGNHSTTRAAKTMKAFIEEQSAYVRPFIDNINTVNRIFNETLAIGLDENNLYLIEDASGESKK